MGEPVHEPAQYACSHTAASALLNSVSLWLAEGITAVTVAWIWIGTSQETQPGMEILAVAPTQGHIMVHTYHGPYATFVMLSGQIIVDSLACAWLHMASERWCLQ